MSERIGILYATVDGHTTKICNEIVKLAEEKNVDIQLFTIDAFTKNIADFDKFIIASSIRYGVHNKEIIAFIKKNKTVLDTIKTAFFSVNLVARKPEKNTPETNPYVVKFFKNIDWKPTITEVFAGMLDYKRYKPFDRIMIQFIMWMTKGPTNKNIKIEYTDWKKVEAFAMRVINF
ncbi:menaquinone-dependent protoporphyrinogen IX dehydrogenase [Lutibacter sp. A80]|uniref:menaquinone-dependent protoporphyrinogen IX dehydrogenase n=1 Tax=Lutibacter sp. A80 TaxID=2918453 RepID=UPI001F05A8DA|nr:menaquinone-dependent protoporphyrinogen IX dehydrogenase [Lutibacter sp. A80]UMB59614.1 menaquinone-dependent protoporphyrinogen IX dehydrogenase [Lutibacter sp. A80]